MNTEKVERKFKNLNSTEKIIQSWNLEKPKLPTPHQIVKEIVNTVFFKKLHQNVRLYIMDGLL